MERFGAYIPIDRRHALAQHRTLSNRTAGAALFADISGFTPLTEALANELGPRRGAEELTHQLNRVYTALVNNVHLFQGCVIGFAGDAITCWFEHDRGIRAISCALAMQSDMARLGDIVTPGGRTVELAIKTAVATGDVRRFLIGDPQIQRLDILAGDTLAQMADAEHMAERGDVVITEPVLQANQGKLRIQETRTDEHGRLYGVVTDVISPITLPPWPRLARELSEEEMREWLLPPVYRNLKASEGSFLAELRPAATIFMYFDGIDYDGDDDAGEKLDRYIVWVQNILKKYEGSLLQLIMGDKGSYLYAAFGAPISYGDDQARAVAAGLELSQPPTELNYIQNTKIGVSHGRMRTGAYGGETRMTYGVLGDEVNTSARLMQKAAVGQVMVSPQIEEAVRGQYELRGLGEIELKGKAQPLSVFEVVRLKEEIGTVDRGEYVIIGRDETLAEMEVVLDQALDGKGQVLRAEGPAGIGKSHLAYEFTRRAKRKGARLLSGGCQSTTQATPYYPWRQVFRSLFDVSMHSKGSANIDSHLQWQIEIVTAEVMNMNPDWWLRLPLLGDLLGLPIVDNAATAAFDPRLRQEALFTLAVEIIQHKAEERPLLIYLDDIHWMDEASAGLTIALARALSNHAVLLLFMHRPPVDSDKPVLPALNELEHHNWLDLSELPTAAVTALAEAKLGGPLSPLAADVIQTQAQGNPFFTEELVSSLREGEQLVEVERPQGVQWELIERIFESLLEANCMEKLDGEWHLKDEASFSASDLGLPDSIHGIVLSRLDRLEEAEKLTVKVASVVGRLFEFDLLRDIHPSNPQPASLMAQILGIETRDFVQVELPDPRLTYMFKHGTMQEVAYDTLLFAQRRELHSTIAEWIELNFAGSSSKDDDGPTKDDPLASFYPLLAYHWRYAENLEKEVHYSILAGEQAAAQFANEDALRFFGRALELMTQEDLISRYKTLLKIEQVYSLTAQRDLQVSTLLALKELSDQVDANDMKAAYLSSVSKYNEAISDFPKTIQTVQDIIVLAMKMNDNSLHIDGLIDWGQALWRQGNLDDASDKLEEALGLSRFYQLESSEASILLNLGTVSLYQNNIEKANEYYQGSLQINQKLGNRQAQANVYTNSAGMFYHLGDFSQCQIFSEKALQIYREIGDRRGETQTLSNLGSIFHALGQLDIAKDYLEKSLELFVQIEEKRGESMAANNLGLVLADAGNFEAAQRYSLQAVSIDREIGDQIGEGYSLTSLAIALERQKDYVVARSTYQEALGLRKSIGQDSSAIDCLVGIAKITKELGDEDQALILADEISGWLDENSVHGIEHPIVLYNFLVDVYLNTRPDLAQKWKTEGVEFVKNRAKLISDLKTRQQFVENAPHHKALFSIDI